MKFKTMYTIQRDKEIVDIRFYYCKLNYQVVYEMGFLDFSNEYFFNVYVLNQPVYCKEKYLRSKRTLIKYYYFDTFIVKEVHQTFARKVFDYYDES